jgi:hypothetical protein
MDVLPLGQTRSTTVTRGKNLNLTGISNVMKERSANAANYKYCKLPEMLPTYIFFPASLQPVPTLVLSGRSIPYTVNALEFRCCTSRPLSSTTL